MRYWILKQRGRRLGMTWNREPGDEADWIAIGERAESSWSWRGPSLPRERVFELQAGDLVIVWDSLERFVWEADVALGRSSWHTWTDENDEEVSGWGAELVRVAAYPCDVTDEEAEEIKGPLNAAGRRSEGRITLHSLHPKVGAALWTRILSAAATEYLGEEEEA